MKEGCQYLSLGNVEAMLVTRRLEIEALILVLLTMLRPGVPITTLNGKSRVKVAGRRGQGDGELHA
jgi:hypothetical protein